MYVGTPCTADLRLGAFGNFWRCPLPMEKWNGRLPPQGAVKKLAKVEVERRVLTSTASDVPKWKF